ncbi:GIY-YIG nuclease family protein [Vibrio sp. S17_S38]|uniref:GIY-YIG nuclease family protein n=1 Tax=Vibrio sp. S17_S38 TaxID=2720229 RepID=UPI0016818061|nr:GIY-YIG nuclease family protein [Vibrio sp. S17_S38]MBD1573271.1 GIY-YIG nuclease family protein [Vibrio sp. S17_S38]
MKQPCIYILSNTHNNVLYIGVSSNLKQRIWQHKSGGIKGFTQRYQLHKLVHYELYSDMIIAIQREKQLKAWKKQWKNNLITKHNKEWADLYDQL